MRTSVPKEFTIGESLAWEKSWADYPASEWTLTYYFRGVGAGFNVAATADGATFAVAVAKTVTATAAAGAYKFQAFVEKGSEKILVDSGDITAIQSFASLPIDEEIDPRSDAKKMLDVINARLSGDVSRGVLEYQIGDRELRRYSLAELRDLRSHYAGIVAREESRKRGGLFKNHYVQFRRP